uniref:Ovule protein n=1 Tax=Syphacia muris TaxID=451379 RepID=A0A0N5AUX3_9BILA
MYADIRFGCKLDCRSSIFQVSLIVVVERQLIGSSAALINYSTIDLPNELMYLSICVGVLKRNKDCEEGDDEKQLSVISSGAV